VTQSTASATALLNRIREHGYWRIVIRPARFAPEHISDIKALHALVKDLAVRFQGWEYPRIGQAATRHSGNDWVEQAVEQRHHKEYWRFYQSGQFIDYVGIAEDWHVLSVRWATRVVDQPEKLLPVYDTLYRFTEIFEFAARLALSNVYDPGESMRVEVLLTDLQDRSLYNDSQRYIRLGDSRPATLDRFQEPIDLPPSALIADARSLALREAERLFSRFNWEPTPGLLRSMQEEFTGQSR
jgi:hypothetical protein